MYASGLSLPCGGICAISLCHVVVVVVVVWHVYLCLAENESSCSKFGNTCWQANCKGLIGS